MCFKPLKVFWKNGNSGLVVKEVTSDKNYNDFPIAKVLAKGEFTKLDIGHLAWPKVHTLIFSRRKIFTKNINRKPSLINCIFFCYFFNILGN